ncbi:MAG TPA: isopentenyl-diphosphate Delta-isomerase [Nocardioidaceae bacterium]|nr:isopentenyl-diphosphate Delta-isomerase [Nocardioidaceae bacterium]
MSAEIPSEAIVEVQRVEMQDVEKVVLLDEQGNAIGVAPKRDVHHERTPLHLAFSCYVFDTEGALLITRRAGHKKTWPGMWTNTACGHPAPGEDIFEAVQRRMHQELGIAVRGLRVVLPEFRYRAVMDNGVTENEICPVFMATTVDRPTPDADEVGDTAWVPWPTFRDDVVQRRRQVTPWCIEQVEQLATLPDNSHDGRRQLPGAARPAGHRRQ